MEIFPGKIRRLWNLWELRYLVLISLFIQTLLISFASVRKHTAARKISFLIWSCYLLADWVATLALGVLAECVNNKSNGDDHQSAWNDKDDLKAFWAPFLLLHLGGPDNITAFSLEDNELWLRHLLGLLFQVGTALYVFIMSLPVPTWLWVITILMFMGAIIKYVERTLALMNASRDYFRKSMVTDPDPGPNYAKFMEEYSCKRNAGLVVSIAREKEPESQLPSIPDIDEKSNEDSSKVEIELISKAHHFFQIFKRLIVDLILTFHDRNESRSFFFTEKSWEKAYKVIEIELGFLYEVLYTKAAVVHTLKGWILRFTSVSSIIVVSIIFFGFTDKQRYDKIDVRITYVLLSGAIALEIWSLARLFVTDWTIVWMKKKKNLNRFTRIVFIVLSWKRPPNRSRWSNSMAQYNLIKFCLKDQQPFFGTKVMELMIPQLKDLFDNHRHRSYIEISDDLKKFIFDALKRMLEQARDYESLRRLRTSRGQLALNGKNDGILDNSINAEFDESILLWHIATDICYYLDGGVEDVEHPQPKTVLTNLQKTSRDISNYMLYLLVSRPSMLTAGIGQIRFGDTCAEAKRFFHRRGTETSEKQACTRLNKVDTEVPPVQVKGDRSKSVLFEASRVAKSLLVHEPNVVKRWEMISRVWLEMLCYAASECRGYYHAQRLSAGGELLTVVCFLMAHLGIGEQYRVESGHARAKLIVKM
ncbi:uncharacterized protein LOC122668843 [Telopea speciosissima]|uniref:uncharacterized protein LOC122668843 n=1 Tax=Telopea speciosissima TaxID=54955 RepID=UPI001CC3CA4D|nr:uncharacterized protein LOC122668843 [Telopea speciosissima]